MKIRRSEMIFKICLLKLTLAKVSKKFLPKTDYALYYWSVYGVRVKFTNKRSFTAIPTDFGNREHFKVENFNLKFSALRSVLNIQDKCLWTCSKSLESEVLIEHFPIFQLSQRVCRWECKLCKLGKLLNSAKIWRIFNEKPSYSSSRVRLLNYLLSWIRWPVCEFSVSSPASSRNDEEQCWTLVMKSNDEEQRWITEPFSGVRCVSTHRLLS